MPENIRLEVDPATGGEWAARAGRHDLTYEDLAEVLLAVANTHEDTFQEAANRSHDGSLDPTSSIDRPTSVRRPRD